MISITTLAKIKMAAEKADDFDVEALLEETYNKVQPLPVPDDELVVSKEASNCAIRIILNKFFEAAPINATVWGFMKFLTSYVITYNEGFNGNGLFYIRCYDTLEHSS